MGYAEKRGDTWRARFKLPNGKYDSKPGFLTKEQAKAYANAQETDIRRGDWFDPSHGDITFRAWSERWLDGLTVAPDSEYGYRKRLNSRILPQWGDWPLSHITSSSYQLWEKELKSENLSENYVNQLTGLFRLMLDDAVAHKPPLLKVNPAPAPSRKRGRYTARVEKDAIIGTPKQVLQLAENSRKVWGLTGYAFILTKAYCGLRQGEMYGLRREWCHPNWPASDPGWPDNPGGKGAEVKRKRLAQARYAAMPALRVQYQHQYVRPPGGGKRVAGLVPPKYQSCRNLVLPPFLAELLAELLDSHDSEWVFPSMDGGPLLATDFSTYYWQPALLGAEARAGRYAREEIGAVEGIEEMVPHGLRHGMKVWLDETGEHSRVAVEERMGHRLQGVEATYSQVTPKMEERIAQSLQAIWESSQR